MEKVEKKCPANNTTHDVSEKSDIKINNLVANYRRNIHKEFAQNITLHGYRNLVKETGWRKLSWMLVMTFFLSSGVYMFYQMLLDFGHKTELVYELEDRKINHPYPTITICTNSPAYTEKSFKNFPINITEDQYKRFYLEEVSNINYMHDTSAQSVEILEKLGLLNITSYKDILQMFDSSVEDTADVWKEFTGGPTCYLGAIPCNFTRDFKATSHWKFSLCHQWNYYVPARPPKRQTTSDQTFTMLLNIHATHKLISFYPFYGLVLYVHPYGTPHHLTAHTDMFGLQSGMFTHVHVEETEVNLLPVPYSTSCGRKELPLIKHFPYSRALGEVDCVLQKVYKKCACVGFDFEGQVDSHIPICSFRQIKCYHRYISKYKSSCMHYAATKCPRECRFYKYHFQRSLIMNIGEERMQNGFKKMPGWNKTDYETNSFIRQNLVGFEMGYKGLSQHKQNFRPAVTFSEVVGVVGGSIGICLGFSFVTGYQILFFIFDYITARLRLIPFFRSHNGNTLG